MNLQESINLYFQYFNNEKLPYLLCKKCGHKFYYARAVCPKCLSSDLEIRESKGEGTVYSFTKFVNSKGKEVIVGIVQLEEGFKIYCNIMEDEENRGIDIDKKVRVTFGKLPNGQKYPLFKII